MGVQEMIKSCKNCKYSGTIDGEDSVVCTHCYRQEEMEDCWEAKE